MIFFYLLLSFPEQHILERPGKLPWTAHPWKTRQASLNSTSLKDKAIFSEQHILESQASLNSTSLKKVLNSTSLKYKLPCKAHHWNIRQPSLNSTSLKDKTTNSTSLRDKTSFFERHILERQASSRKCLEVSILRHPVGQKGGIESFYNHKKGNITSILY